MSFLLALFFNHSRETEAYRGDNPAAVTLEPAFSVSAQTVRALCDTLLVLALLGQHLCSFELPKPQEITASSCMSSTFITPEGWYCG